MSDYLKATNFAAKDTLASGDPAKKIRGTEINDEFNAIQTAIATKVDRNSPAFTGVPTAPLPSIGSDNTQIATTEWVRDIINAIEPVGTIKAWAASISNIPAGWALCNGANGTLNLTDRFIAAFGEGVYGQNGIAGWFPGQLQVPVEGTVLSSGSHSHGSVTGSTALTEAQMPVHNHNGVGGSFYTAAGAPNVATGPGLPIAFTGNTANAGSGEGHAHAIDADGTHVHAMDGTTASAPVPGFFALAFIQKIALL